MCQKDGYCWATNGYFAELYEVSKETVSRWISNLQDCGYVKISLNSEYENGRRIILFDISNVNVVDEKINTPMTKKSTPPMTKKSNIIIQDNNNTRLTGNVVVVSANTTHTEVDPQLQQLSEFYQNNIGTIAPAIWQDMLYYIQQGFEIELIKFAIKKGVDGGGNTRNWRYIKGILNKWLTNNIRTLMQAQAEQVERGNHVAYSSPTQKTFAEIAAEMEQKL